MRMWSPLLITAVVVLACMPERDEEEGDLASGLVTEADSLRCTTSSTLHTNLSPNAKDLHVRVSYHCTDVDSIVPLGARLRVLDNQGRVVANQDVTVTNGAPFRGTMNVPNGARLMLECRGVRYDAGTGCTWSYSYSP